MFSPTKWILTKYKILVVKMHDDLHTYCGNSTKINFQYFCDIEMVMGLACIMFLLE
jgi:hypothetical protein